MADSHAHLKISSQEWEAFLDDSQQTLDKFHVRAGRRVPDYICRGRSVDDPQPICQWISGKDVDEAVGELLLEIVTPVDGMRRSIPDHGWR